jgi:hypothetical protein
MSVIKQKYTPTTTAVPIDLNLAKRFLYVDFDEDDYLISTLVKSAISDFEKQTGVLLRPSACEVTVSKPIEDVLQPFAPITSNITQNENTYTFTAGHEVDAAPEGIVLIVLNILSVMYEARGPVLEYPATLKMQIKSYSLYP